MQMPILPDSYDQHPWIPETEQTSILWVLHKKYVPYWHHNYKTIEFNVLKIWMKKFDEQFCLNLLRLFSSSSVDQC